MKMETGKPIDGEIKKMKSTDKNGGKDTTRIGNSGGRGGAAAGVDAKPLKSGVKDAGMMSKKPKVSPVEPKGSRMDQWVAKREKTKKTYK